MLTTIFDLLKALGAYSSVFALIIISVFVLWKYVLKSVFEDWSKNRLEIKKIEITNALDIQKNLILKQAEFEMLKLNRILPELERLNSNFYNHWLMFNTYVSYIVNKAVLPEGFESKRLELDKQMVDSITQLSIYLPSDFRLLINKLRLLASNSWKPPLSIYSYLSDLGYPYDIPMLAQDIYVDLIECFYEFSNKFIGIGNNDVTYSEIMVKHNLDEKFDSTKTDPLNLMAWQYIMFHESYDSRMRAAVDNAVKEHYKNLRKEA